MIRRPNNWDSVQSFAERKKLPLGAYVCKIRKAVVQSNNYGSQLCILFDIAEGDFKQFYAEDYAANTNADKKWRGILRYWIASDDGTDSDELTKRTFKGLVTALEKSNPGYVWNWDENSLAGKMLGILFRNEEWVMDDKSGWTVRPFRAISVESVREGNYTTPKDKPHKDSVHAVSSAARGAANTSATEYEDDDDVPF